MDEHVVWIVEDRDDLDPSFWSGLFSARCQAACCRDNREGLDRVSADDAIAWGRTHAPVVLIRQGEANEYYSAGEQPPANCDVLSWPPEGAAVGRRRDPDMDYLDRTVLDPPIRWSVKFVAPLASTPAGFEAHFVARAVEAGAVIETSRSASAVEFRFDLDGTVRHEVLETAKDIALAAMRSASIRSGVARPATGWNFSLSAEPVVLPGADARLSVA